MIQRADWAHCALFEMLQVVLSMAVEKRRYVRARCQGPEFEPVVGMLSAELVRRAVR